VHEIGLTDRVLRPEEDADCLEFGFGFTDLAKGVSGMDRVIPDKAFDTKSVYDVIRRYRPRALAFNGKKAAQVALQQNDLAYGLWRSIEATKVWILPSTSGAANAHWSIGPWLDMKAGLK
jgi:TDG/mug DNA glycosylase family protein